MSLYAFETSSEALTFALIQIKGLTRLSLACHEFAGRCTSAVHVLNDRVCFVDAKRHEMFYYHCAGYEKLQSSLNLFLSNNPTNVLLTESTLSKQRLRRFVSEEQCFCGAFQHPDVSPLITIRFCDKDDTDSWLTIFSFVSKTGGMCLAVCQSTCMEADRADYSQISTFSDYMGSIVAVLADLDDYGYWLWYDSVSSLTDRIKSSFSL